MIERNGHLQSTLEAHHDGVLSEQQDLAFERRIDNSPELQRELAMHRSIDDVLRRHFIPPPESESESILEAARTASAEPRQIPIIRRIMPSGLPRGGGGGWRIAAAVTCVIIGAWLMVIALGSLNPKHIDPYGPRQTFLELYASAVSAGFEPQWRCADDAEFAQTFHDHYRQNLLARETPGVELLGLSYSNTITRQTVCLLARVDQEPVMVFIDRVEPDSGQTLPPESDLNLFSRRVGVLVLYELTPHDSPSLLDAFYIPAEMMESP